MTSHTIKSVPTPSESATGSFEVEGLSSFCKAAGDPLRLDILTVLRRDSFGVQELAKIFSMPQPGMSHHLKILATAGLVVTRREGNSIFYRRALVRSETKFSLLQNSLFATLDALPLQESYGEKIEAIYQERARQSRLYFEKNSARFSENQGMLCDVSQYMGGLRELLDLANLPKSSLVLEVGPGQGLLLEELNQRFDNLIALDNSTEMLDLARQRFANQDQRPKFIVDSFENYRGLKDRALDAIVLNMVLHHMPSPTNVFRKFKDLVRQNGYLLIAELCAHDQAWTRESCGDLWLGFDPVEIEEWATNAGFQQRQSLYLSLKNGFQIQLTLCQRL